MLSRWRARQSQRMTNAESRDQSDNDVHILKRRTRRSQIPMLMQTLRQTSTDFGAVTAETIGEEEGIGLAIPVLHLDLREG